MRKSKLLLLAAGCTSLLGVSIVLPNRAVAQTRDEQNCPTLEGYPDCVDGHLVDAPDLFEGPGAERQRIENLEARYELAVNSGDADAYASLFTDDAVLESPEGAILGREAIRAARAQRPPIISAPHLVMNIRVRIDGDRAASTASWSEIDAGRSGQQPQVGHYEDQFVRSHGQWLFIRRRIVTS
jgi:uncharacterized protein (TIGR02246 family)